MNRILIIEDEPGVQVPLCDLLQSEGYEVVIKGDGVSGEQEAKTGVYDLIMLDVMLPGKDGFAVCRSLRKHGISTPVIILTARDTNIDTVIGLRQGADDYITKPFDAEVLLARIEAVIRRNERKSKTHINQPVHFGKFLLNPLTEELLKNNTPVFLNVQEYRLLLYFAAHPNQTLSREKLLDEVWGYDSDSTTRTVDVHISKLRQKIEETEIPKFIITVRRKGYKFCPGD